MSPRRTRRGTIRENIIEISVDNSLKSISKTLRSTRRGNKSQIIKGSEEESDNPVEVNSSLDNVNSFIIDTSLKKRKRDKKVPEVSARQDSLLNVTIEESKTKSRTKKRNLKTPKFIKKTKNNKSEIIDVNSLISEDESDTKSQADEKKVSYVINNIISEDEEIEQTITRKKSKSNSQNQSFKKEFKTPEISQKLSTNQIKSEKEVTPKSSPLNISFTPHRSSKTPKKSPINLGSPKTHSQDSFKLLNVQRKLSIEDSPSSSDNSNNSLQEINSSNVVNVSFENIKTKVKNSKSISKHSSKKRKSISSMLKIRPKFSKSPKIVFRTPKSKSAKSKKSSSTRKKTPTKKNSPSSSSRSSVSPSKSKKSLNSSTSSKTSPANLSKKSKKMQKINTPKSEKVSRSLAQSEDSFKIKKLSKSASKSSKSSKRNSSMKSKKSIKVTSPVKSTESEEDAELKSINLSNIVSKKSKKSPSKKTTSLTKSKNSPSKTTSPAKSKNSPFKTTSPAKSKNSPSKTTSPAKSKNSPSKTTSPAKSKNSPSKTTSPAKSKNSPSKTTSPAKSKKSPFKTTSSAKSKTSSSKTTSQAKSTKSPKSTPSISKKMPKIILSSKKSKSISPSKSKKSPKIVSPSKTKISVIVSAKMSVSGNKISKTSSMSPRVIIKKLSSPQLNNSTLIAKENQPTVNLVPVDHIQFSPKLEPVNMSINTYTSQKSSIKKRSGTTNELNKVKPSVAVTLSTYKKTPSDTLENKFINLKPTNTSTPRERIKRTFNLVSDQKNISSKRSRSSVLLNGSSTPKPKPIKRLNNQSNVKTHEPLLENESEPSLNNSSLIHMSDVFDSDNSQKDNTFEINNSNLDKIKSSQDWNISQKSKVNNTFEIKKNSSTLTKVKSVKDDTFELESSETELQLKSNKRKLHEYESSDREEPESKKSCRVHFVNSSLRHQVQSTFVNRVDTSGYAIPQKKVPVSISKAKTPINQSLVNKIESRRRVSSVSKLQVKTPVSTPINKRRSNSLSDTSLRSRRSNHEAQIASVNRLSKPKPITNSEKKLGIKTPVIRKIPNFTEIHQKNFAKMESLVDLKKRVEKRHVSLNTASSSLSTKKAPATKYQNGISKPAPSDSTNGVYNKFGFKLRKIDAVNMVSNKQAGNVESRERKRENARNVLKGVRMNRRFELQMKSRIKNS